MPMYLLHERTGAELLVQLYRDGSKDNGRFNLLDTQNRIQTLLALGPIACGLPPGKC